MSRNQRQDREAVLQVCKHLCKNVLITLSLRAGKYSNILSVYTGLNKSFILITEDHTAGKNNAADHNAFPKRVLGCPAPSTIYVGWTPTIELGILYTPPEGPSEATRLGFPHSPLGSRLPPTVCSKKQLFLILLLSPDIYLGFLTVHETHFWKHCCVRIKHRNVITIHWLAKKIRCKITCVHFCNHSHGSEIAHCRGLEHGRHLPPNAGAVGPAHAPSLGQRSCRCG